MEAILLSSEKHDYNTPPEVLERVRSIAPIGLDPCANSSSIVAAEISLSLENGADGLAADWYGKGLVFVNPPYGRMLSDWALKIDAEAQDGTEIIVLVPARPDTAWFARIWKADVICFWRGRITFLGEEHPAPFPSSLAYWGPRPFVFASAFSDAGKIIFP